MGVHCPCLVAPYPTVHPIPLYHGMGGTVHGSTLSHLRAPYPTVRPIPLYHGTGGTVHGSTLSHLRAQYPTVRPIPLYHGMGGTVHGSTLSHLRDGTVGQAWSVRVGLSNGRPMDVHLTGGLDGTVGQAWSVRVGSPMDVPCMSIGQVDWTGQWDKPGQ